MMSNFQLIISFRNFLINSWPSIMEIMEHLDWDGSPYFIDDWIQSNWELLVEKQVLETGQLLASYGYNISSNCRYAGKGGTITHRVVCKKKTGSEIQYYFLCFTAKEDGWGKIQPPFDVVDVEDVMNGDRLSLPIDELDFSIAQIVAK